MWFDAREELHYGDEDDGLDDLTDENISIEANSEFPFTLGKVWEQEEHQSYVATAIREMKGKVRHVLRKQHEEAVRQAEDCLLYTSDAAEE